MAGRQGIFGFRGWGPKRQAKKKPKKRRGITPVVISHTEDGVGIEDIPEEELQPNPPPVVIVESEDE